MNYKFMTYGHPDCVARFKTSISDRANGTGLELQRLFSEFARGYKDTMPGMGVHGFTVDLEGAELPFSHALLTCFLENMMFNGRALELEMGLVISPGHQYGHHLSHPGAMRVKCDLDPGWEVQVLVQVGAQVVADANELEVPPKTRDHCQVFPTWVD